MSPELIVVLTAVLVAIPCSLVGCFLVLRKMAMLGDAISHAVLPGIVIAFFLAGGPEPIPVILGATALGLITVVLVEALNRSRLVKEDAAIGLVFPALFALGVFMVSRFGKGVHLDTQHVLYGEIAYAPFDTLIVNGIALGPKPMWVLGIITLLDLALILLFYKELKLVSFDPGLAAVLGFSPIALHYLLMSAVSVTTVAAFDSVGAILVVALLIVPPSTAYLLTDRLPLMLSLSVVAGILSAVLGYGLARLVDGSIAGAMATVAGLLFGLAALGSPRYGAVARLLQRAQRRRQFAADLLLAHLAERELRPTLATSTAAAGPNVTPAQSLQERFHWNRQFARQVVGQLVASGLAVPAPEVGAADLPDVTLTDRGRQRAADLLSV
ncbi:MAG: metal ABC transporter permease [Chloroflexi bacterium]|nr:metal ABC transporter permease [Chloroflexota bacterium]